MSGENVKIGIAFGSGGAKGGAHIGIMKVFEKYNIKPTFISGASIGSIVGAAYALGFDSDRVLKGAERFNSSKFTRVNNFNLFSDSLIKDREINDAIYCLLGDATFEDLKIPFIASAVDLESGTEVLLREGKLWEVARASAAIPFVFSPKFLGEKFLVDGALLNSTPVDHIRNHSDSDIIIGIELGGMTSRQYISAMIWEKYYKKPKMLELDLSFFTKWKLNTNLMAHILLRSIDIARAESQDLRIAKAKPDIMIRPQVDTISMLDFKLYGQAIQAGIDAAEEVVPTIQRLIESKSIEKEMKSQVAG